jgi:hypothetical protein
LEDAGCGALQENVGDGDCPGTGRQLVVLIARDDRHLSGAAIHGEINETVARDDCDLPVAVMYGQLKRQWREMTVTSPEPNSLAN